MGKYCELKGKRVMVTGAASGIGLLNASPAPLWRIIAPLASCRYMATSINAAILAAALQRKFAAPRARSALKL